MKKMHLQSIKIRPFHIYIHAYMIEYILYYIYILIQCYKYALNLHDHPIVFVACKFLLVLAKYTYVSLIS